MLHLGGAHEAAKYRPLSQRFALTFLSRSIVGTCGHQREWGSFLQFHASADKYEQESETS
jgi:hypothetical protein